jgi:hypothetical protein
MGHGRGHSLAELVDKLVRDFGGDHEARVLKEWPYLKAVAKANDLPIPEKPTVLLSLEAGHFCRTHLRFRFSGCEHVEALTARPGSDNLLVVELDDLLRALAGEGPPSRVVDIEIDCHVAWLLVAAVRGIRERLAKVVNVEMVSDVRAVWDHAPGQRWRSWLSGLEFGNVAAMKERDRLEAENASANRIKDEVDGFGGPRMFLDAVRDTMGGNVRDDLMPKVRVLQRRSAKLREAGFDMGPTHLSTLIGHAQERLTASSSGTAVRVP